LPVVEVVVAVQREVAARDQHPGHAHAEREGGDRRQPDAERAGAPAPLVLARRRVGRGHDTGADARRRLLQTVAMPIAAATTSATSAGARYRVTPNVIAAAKVATTAMATSGRIGILRRRMSTR